MIKDPKAHFLTQRYKQITDLSNVPKGDVPSIFSTTTLQRRNAPHVKPPNSTRGTTPWPKFCRGQVSVSTGCGACSRIFTELSVATLPVRHHCGVGATLEPLLMKSADDHGKRRHQDTG
jgi:hypothetical protein